MNPKVQSMIQEFFNGKEPNTSINPDEAMEYGAAVQGSILTEKALHKRRTCCYLTRLLAHGLKIVDGVTTKLSERNTTSPTKAAQTLTTMRTASRDRSSRFPRASDYERG